MIYGGDAPNIRMNFNESDSRYTRSRLLHSEGMSSALLYVARTSDGRSGKPQMQVLP